MKIYVTGATGKLGSELVQVLRYYDHHVLTNKIDVKSEMIIGFINKTTPDVVIHTAAFTDVDACESNLDAYQINVEGTKNVGHACRLLQIPMVYISSDYVFDGKLGRPYTESDLANPISIYGRSKYDGELGLSKLEKLYILRTAWLYDKSTINTIKNAKDQKAWVDRFLSPTSVYSLSQIIAALIKTNKYGIYNAVDTGYTSPYCFMKEISNSVLPSVMDEERRPAPRPRYSVLDNSKLSDFINIPTWKNALKRYL